MWSWMLKLLGRPDYFAILRKAQARRGDPIKGGPSRRVLIAIEDKRHIKGISTAAKHADLADYFGSIPPFGSRRLEPASWKPYLLYVGYDNSDGVATAAANSIVAALQEHHISCNVYFEID